MVLMILLKKHTLQYCRDSRSKRCKRRDRYENREFSTPSPGGIRVRLKEESIESDVVNIISQESGLILGPLDPEKVLGPAPESDDPNKPDNTYQRLLLSHS